MKKIIIIFVIALNYFIINNVYAANDDSVSTIKNYAVINIIEVMNQSKAVNDIKQQVAIYKSNLQKQAEVEQANLRQNEQDVINKQNDLSPKDFNKAKQDFQLKVQNAQKSFYDKSVNLDKVSNEALGIVQNKIASILDGIAKNNKYDIIFQVNALAYYPTSKDITKDVVSQLNKMITKVQVKKPF